MRKPNIEVTPDAITVNTKNRGVTLDWRTRKVGGKRWYKATGEAWFLAAPIGTIALPLTRDSLGELGLFVDGVFIYSVRGSPVVGDFIELHIQSPPGESVSVLNYCVS